MANIRLDRAETELWNEVGSRGDKFREAMRDRAYEEARVAKQVTEVVDDEGRMVDAIVRTDLVPESAVPAEEPRSSPHLSIHDHEGNPKSA
jgi:hypothetical protein